MVFEGLSPQGQRIWQFIYKLIEEGYSKNRALEILREGFMRD